MSTTQQYIDAMKQSFQASKAGGLRITYQFQVSGSGGGTWGISIADGRCNITPGAPSRADVSITMSVENYLKLAAGNLNVMAAYQQGQIQVGGNPQLALKFTELFSPWASRVGQAPASAPPPPSPEPTPSTPTPSPTPAPTPSTPTPSPTPAPTAPMPTSGPAPTPGSVYPQLMNGGFNEFQLYHREGQGAKVWKEDRFPDSNSRFGNCAADNYSDGLIFVGVRAELAELTNQNSIILEILL